MATYQQLLAVAKECPGYEMKTQGFISRANSNVQTSCENCKNFVDDKCKAGLFDEVLSELDEK
ncbi:hypothetical protein [Clostridium sp. DL1XJH146]